jgi:hypothetical protein
MTFSLLSLDHTLIINRPTKRRKENSPSDGRCQCEKKMDGLACQQSLEKSHEVTLLANERASFLKIIDIKNILFIGTSDWYICCSIAFYAPDSVQRR